MEAEIVVRKWGNSLGLILPKEVVMSQNIKENEKIVIEVKKRQIGKEFLGLLIDWNKEPQSIKDQIREGWE